MKYKNEEYYSNSAEHLTLRPDAKAAASVFHTIGGDIGPTTKPNPHAPTYCKSCRGIRAVNLTVSPFGGENYTSSSGKPVECLQMECRACGNGWPVYAVGEKLYRKAPKRK